MKQLLAAIISIGLLTSGCGDKPPVENQTQSPIRIDLSKIGDGTYTAESSRDEKLGMSKLTLTVQDHRITNAEFVGFDLFGNVKDEDYGSLTGKDSADYKKAQIAVKANADYAKQLVETQSLDQVDAISGATISYNQFVEAVGKAIGTSDHAARSEKVMGTLLTLKADGENAKLAIDESFNKIAALVEHIKSDTAKLNAAAAGEYIPINRDTFEMIKISQRYSEQTGGAFDATVGAAIELWKSARKIKTLPSEVDIDNAKSRVGFRHLHLRDSDNSVMLDREGVKLDFGGIAKGYAVDLARRTFIEHGIGNGLIDFGSSTICALGSKKIGLKNPRGGGVDQVVELQDGVISTSGDYERFFELGGRRYHHIIEPKTCLPVDNGIASVSVAVAGDVEYCATVADILSTSVFVLGEERSQALLPQSQCKLLSVARLDDRAAEY